MLTSPLMIRTEMTVMASQLQAIPSACRNCLCRLQVEREKERQRLQLLQARQLAAQAEAAAAAARAAAAALSGLDAPQGDGPPAVVVQAGAAAELAPTPDRKRRRSEPHLAFADCPQSMWRHIRMRTRHDGHKCSALSYALRLLSAISDGECMVSLGNPCKLVLLCSGS